MPARTIVQGISEEKRKIERRRAPRYQFIADVEVTEIPTTAKLEAKTGDLSIGGCFLHLSTPLPEGTQIQVNISHAITTFTALGRVAFVLPNLGMGVKFTIVESDQQLVLRSWVTELSRCKHAFQSKYERLFAKYNERRPAGGDVQRFSLLYLLVFVCLFVWAWGLFSK